MNLVACFGWNDDTATSCHTGLDAVAAAACVAPAGPAAHILAGLAAAAAAAEAPAAHSAAAGLDCQMSLGHQIMTASWSAWLLLLQEALPWVC